jgi:hypothetical protein
MLREDNENLNLLLRRKFRVSFVAILHSQVKI